MSDHEIAQYCQEKFRQYDEHLKESIPVRDSLKTMESCVGWLTKRLDAIENSALSIKLSLIGVVIAILMQIGGFIYLWGGLNKQVDTNNKRIAEIEELFPRHVAK